MFLQLPLIRLTMPLGRSKTAMSKLIGNAIFWVSFTIFGQPFAALMYFYAWQVSFPPSLVPLPELWSPCTGGTRRNGDGLLTGCRQSTGR